jgi:hypothetical protein
MISAARAALMALLTADPQFVADMQALQLGINTTAVIPRALKGNRRFDQLSQNEYPCWLNDAGDQQGASAANEGGDPAGLVLNSTQQDWAGDIELSLIWLQQDYERSVDQTDAVLPALVRLLLRNPGLQDTCTLAYVADVINDRNYRHPTHVTAFTVRVLNTIYRDH